MKKINISLIGCGAMGRNHATAWSQHVDNAEVISVFDPDADARKAVAEEFGAAAYDTYQAAIDHDGVTAVSVCTPTPFRCETTCYAASRGKHILCEKPLAASREDCDAMVEAAERNGVHLCVGHQFREWARNQRVKQAYEAGKFGSPLFGLYTAVAEVRPKLAMHRNSMNRGPVLDMAPHFIDLMRYFTGANPTHVFATGAIFGADKPRLASIEDDDRAIDAAHVHVRYQNGHALTVEVVWGMPEGFNGGESEENIIGPRGRMRKVGPNTELFFGQDEVETLEKTEFSAAPRITDLARAITEGRAPTVTGEDGRISACTALAALESIKTGQVVTLDFESSSAKP